MRLSIGPFLCACIACAYLSGCSDEKPAAPTAVRPARVVVVAPEKLALVAQGAGRVQSRYVSQVGFEVGGRLTSRDVDVGAVVRKGQKLARLSAADFRDRVTASEADLTAAKAVLVRSAAREERYRTLLGNGFTTRALYDEALEGLKSSEARIQAAEANLRIARNQLSYTELLAPDDGIVTATAADPGQVVSAGQKIFEISRSSEREAVFAVASDHVTQARLGMPVKVWLQGRPETSVTGSIRQISPEADSTTGTYEVKVALQSAPPEMRLGAVVVGRAEFEGPETMSIPSTALLQSGDGPQVWVVAEDGKVHSRAIEVLEFRADFVVVKQGLSAGEKVVTAGVNSLAHGQTVKPEVEGKAGVMALRQSQTLKAAMEGK